MDPNPGSRLPVSDVCIVLCSNVRGLATKCSDLTVDPSHYDILWCSAILVSDVLHVSELLVPGFGGPGWMFPWNV